jgi:hypothetical protein
LVAKIRRREEKTPINPREEMRQMAKIRHRQLSVVLTLQSQSCGLRQGMAATVSATRALLSAFSPAGSSPRRTRACKVSAISRGVAPHIVEATLNHVSGHRAGVAGVYNRASYQREKAAALVRWADYVVAIVEGRQSNVLPFPAS